MAKTVKIDVVDKSIADENNRNIPIINQENPCYGYAATAKEVAQLIQLSSYYVYAAGTLNIIDGYSFYKYFPEEAGSSGGGGSSGDITRTEIQEMIDASLPKIDSAMSTTSKNPVQNNTITEFVNSSVASNTANYVGQFASVDELNAYSGTLTNNDYAFVISTDEAGNTKYDRYKWNMKEWLFEYTLNNSSFTAEQWASIQSGIKASDVEQITTNKDDITLIKTTKLDSSNAVGRNVAGTKYSIDGTEYTAQIGAEIFNNYNNIGNINRAVGKYSHAEGYNTTASGENSHAEGGGSKAEGKCSHVEGDCSKATGSDSHAEGWQTIASGSESHAEGWRAKASGMGSHAEGWSTTASSDYQHAQGKYNVEDTEGKYAFIIGNGEGDLTRSNAFAVDWDGKIYVNNATEGVDVSTFSGVGKDVNGTKYTINDIDYTAGTGAEIFNDYTNNKAIGAYSHAEGLDTRAIGDLSHAEGNGTETSATSAHSEGTQTKATGIGSHAEGAGTTASGNYSHAEGSGTQATGDNSHAEGTGSIASGKQSHAGGTGTKASSDDQYVQGKYNVEDTEGKYAFIIGNGENGGKPSNAIAIDWNGLIYVNNATEGVDVSAFKGGIGKDVTGIDFTVGDTTYTAGSNAEIFNDYDNNKAIGANSHAEGTHTVALSENQHVQGRYNKPSDEYAFIIGNGTEEVSSNAFAIDWNGLIYVNNATEGVDIADVGSKAHSHDNKTVIDLLSDSDGKLWYNGTAVDTGVGKNVAGTKYTIDSKEYTAGTGTEIFNDYKRNIVVGEYSHAEGFSTKAIGNYSHAEGAETTASGHYSHAEGQNTTASNDCSHAEGARTTASGNYSHAEGLVTTASGNYSHAEGEDTESNGRSSHAEGAGTTASGNYSHSEGYQTKASSANQHVQGKYNVEDTEGKYAFIIGNGSTDSDENEQRSNAFAIDWNGLIYVNNATEGVDVSKLSSGRSITIDTELSDTSENAVQNKVIAQELNTVKTSISALDTVKHSHDNKDVIDKIGVSDDGKLLYNGTEVSGSSGGVGKNVTGTVYTINGTEYTAESGVEIFNDYTNNKAVGKNSHAEGGSTTAYGNSSHAEGYGTSASGFVSHAEGNRTTASGLYPHAEGTETKASGTASHAEGNGTRAIGKQSHAEGIYTTASGDNSHAEGYNTTASSENQHVQGKYNVEDTEGKYAFIIGNGTTNSKKSNAFAIDWNGLIYVNNATEGVDVSNLSSGGSITLDDSISETSENAVKNKVISAELDTIRQSIPLSVSKLTNDSNYQTKENLDDVLVSYAKTTDIPTVPSNVSAFTNDKQYQTKTDIDTTLSTYAKTADLKTKLSEFENDEEYIKNTVDNLINYYKKIELYTKNEVDTLIGNINKLTSEIVTELPTTDISTSTIYLIKKTDSNAYTQYMYINSTWAELGDTTVDLSNYYSKSDIDDKLSTYATSDAVTTHTSDSTIHVTSDEKTSWNNATAKSHEHDNKTVIDKFSELDGTVLYDGKQIASGTVWNGTKAEYDAIAIKDAETTYVVTDEDDSISGALIDDSSTSTSKTWSAKKISKMISDVIKTHEVITDEYSLQPNSMGKVPINFNLPDNAVVIGIIKADVVYGGDGNISINVLSPDSVQLYNPTSSVIKYKIKMMVSYMLT